MNPRAVVLATSAACGAVQIADDPSATRCELRSNPPAGQWSEPCLGLTRCTCPDAPLQVSGQPDEPCRGIYSAAVLYNDGEEVSLGFQKWDQNPATAELTWWLVSPAGGELDTDAAILSGAWPQGRGSLTIPPFPIFPVDDRRLIPEGSTLELALVTTGGDNETSRWHQPRATHFEYICGSPADDEPLPR